MLKDTPSQVSDGKLKLRLCCDRGHCLFSCAFLVSCLSLGSSHLNLVNADVGRNRAHKGGTKSLLQEKCSWFFLALYKVDVNWLKLAHLKLLFTLKRPLSGYSTNSSLPLLLLPAWKGYSPCFLSNSHSASYVLIAFLMLNIPRLL